MSLKVDSFGCALISIFQVEMRRQLFEFSFFFLIFQFQGKFEFIRKFARFLYLMFQIAAGILVQAFAIIELLFG